MHEGESEASASGLPGLLLLVSVFLIAVCGLVYELIAGALSSYLLGDSVTQFSLVIGLFLTAMGVGSWASRFIRRSLAAWFVGVEIVIGLIGGATALIGFWTFSYTDLYVPVLGACVLAVGVLVGLEIPLVVRLLREAKTLRLTVSNVFTADYLGALAASLLFPFLLLPHLGLVRAGFLTGIANLAVAAFLLRGLRRHVGRARRPLTALVVAGLVFAVAGFAWAGRAVELLEGRLYQDEIVYARDTAHQRLVVTRWRGDVRLYLNGHLQFSSVDEYRYHEALAHPALTLGRGRERVLILGGGDGLLAREVLKYDDVARVDLVDIDPEVTGLFRENPLLARLNERSLTRPRVHLHHVDAMKFLESRDDLFDVILMDLPDPSEPSLSKLYSRSFFRLAARHLTADGRLATQATSPFRSREAFSCIANTLGAVRLGPQRAERLHVRAYHTVVPTFGTWGFVLAARAPVTPSSIRLTVPTRYLSDGVVPGLFVFPSDMEPKATAVNDLDDPVLCRLYRDGYHRHLE